MRDIIFEFDRVHNGKYKYDITSYNNNKQIIDIVCEAHGVFNMSVSQHLKGYGCPYCAGFKKTKVQIIDELKRVHKNFYDYSISSWNNLTDKIKIICPDHGIFIQSLKIHLKGSKCQKCSLRHRESNDDFIKRMKSLDENIITSITQYQGTNKPVLFICKEHGIIERWPQSIKGHICRKCFLSNVNKEKFIKKSIKKYGDRYDYSLVKYINSRTPVEIVDRIEKINFYQSPYFHLNGLSPISYGNLLFKKRANLKHNDKYSYLQSEYISNKNKIQIICPEHGTFEQRPDNHLNGSGCPKCNKFNIKENEILLFIQKSYNDVIITNERILDGKELDIYLPKIKLGFEFNGLYWHSELFRDKNYHLDKTKLALKKNTRLFHIWEDDWTNKQEIVKSMILNKLGKTSNKIYARKCHIKIIDDNSIVRDFLDKNHIQGFVGSNIKLGLFHQNELVSIMTFGTLRRALGQRTIEGSYELIRFCNKINTTVVGGASKLFKYFLERFKPKEVISYSDYSRSTGDMYQKLGFKLKHNSKPNYYYIIDGVRKHRFGFKKDKLVKQGFDHKKTEIKIMNERGYYRIFDCGMQKWILTTM
jgi:hypothetical protein